MNIRNSIIKVLIAGALSFLMISQAKSQQEPQYTQYMFNMLSVNPAYTGTTNAMNIIALSRYQWVGMKGAPRTYTLAVHSPILRKSMGVGFTVISDEVGPMKNYYFSGNYAYRIALTEKITLSMGIKTGFYNYYVALNQLDNVGDDPSFQHNQQKKLSPNIGAGLYLYTNKFYAGLSVPKLINNPFDKSESTINSVSKMKRHLFIIGGYVLQLDNDLAFKPSFMEKIVEGAPPSTEIAAQFLYKQKFWLGSSYRIGDAIAFLFEIKLTDQLLLGYSYDVTLSKLSQSSGGSHEILLTFDFDRFAPKKVKSPRYF